MQFIERIILKLVVIQCIALIIVQAFFHDSALFIHVNKLYQYEGVAGTTEDYSVLKNEDGE